ncbi:transducin beta-like protein 3 [Notothenia coriiceps]|uniref:Transducin beta-like protein 3 n=1 Tax=Notothenia coriiceps TaxID=8208 RepID=A0A6I9P6P5_9TELE|nr:PREDICTED: transducin beta-like protein 3 [Notothenia coriiceps]
MANTNLQFKTNYVVDSKIEPFYKGGKVQISKDENYIFCTCGTRVNVLEISTGKIVHSVEHEDQEDITSFALSCDDEMLVTASRALLLKQWDWRQAQCTRSWRAIHTVPVASMTFDSTSTLLATGGCDGTIKLWDVVKQYCTHNLKGSPGVVHLVQFHPDISRLQLFSSSQDCGIRLWDLSSSKCVCVLQSHYSAVTSLSFSPDGDTMVSSGRDKICTVWDLKTKKAKRAVPVYEVGLVLKADHMTDCLFYCFKTFEGHDASVLKIIFVSRGTQLLTSGSDGLVKLWTIKTNECVKTLDAHQDKVWGLHSSQKDNKIVTGSADSNITVWVDVTEVELAEEQAKQEDQILKQQELSNLLHEKKYLKALGLAISLDQPHTVLNVIKAIRQSENGHELLEKTLLKLRVDQKESLLRYCVVWNTNARNCQNAQAILQVLLTHLQPEELLQYQGARAHLEGLIPYTERHMLRIGNLLQASMFLNYMWQKMRVAGAPASMGQDEDMDTTPLAQPFFMIDKEKGMGSDGEEKQDGDDSDGGQDEDLVKKEEDEEDNEVSATNKSTNNNNNNNGGIANGKGAKTNGNHHSESEESSEEEDPEEEDQTTVKVVKCLPVSSAPECQTSAS